MMNNKIKKIDGANMDIDLTTEKSKISWEQNKCPWNEKDESTKHKCATKNVKICPYFCGIGYLDFVLCCYPEKNPFKK